MASYTANADNPVDMVYSSGTKYGDGWHGYPRNVRKWFSKIY